MITSDAPNCGITYERHYDNRNSFIIQATGEFTGSKFSIYSLDKEFSNFQNIKLDLDFINQQTLGVQIETIIDLIQLNSKFNQVTL